MYTFIQQGHALQLIKSDSKDYILLQYIHI